MLCTDSLDLHSSNFSTGSCHSSPMAHQNLLLFFSSMHPRIHCSTARGSISTLQLVAAEDVSKFFFWFFPVKHWIRFWMITLQEFRNFLSHISITLIKIVKPTYTNFRIKDAISELRNQQTVYPKLWKKLIFRKPLTSSLKPKPLKYSSTSTVGKFSRFERSSVYLTRCRVMLQSLT